MSETVKRFDVGSRGREMILKDHGHYVTYDDYATLKARCESAEGALTEAIEEVESWAGYASPYFQEKHDLEGSLAQLRAHFQKYPKEARDAE